MLAHVIVVLCGAQGGLPEGVVPFPFPFARTPKVINIVQRLYPILANDPSTAPHFSRPQLVAFKRGRNIKDILIKAALIRRTSKPGCHRCSDIQCPLHDERLQGPEQILGEGNSVWSFRFRQMHKIRGGFTCTSRHVIYVITCLKCELQGVGECRDPLERMADYIRAAQQSVQTSGCAIENHFQAADHSMSDMCIQFVDGVPSYGHHYAGVRAVRVRLENIWIRRLLGDRHGGMNVRCQ